MKIYTNVNHKIISLDIEPLEFQYVYELEESPFPNSWNEEKILTYHFIKENKIEKIYP
jgi:hypothetical protein